jgi:hypothetical protein
MRFGTVSDLRVYGVKTVVVEVVKEVSSSL